jgi:hypothetical protein
MLHTASTVLDSFNETYGNKMLSGFFVFKVAVMSGDSVTRFKPM